MLLAPNMITYQKRLATIDRYHNIGARMRRCSAQILEPLGAGFSGSRTCARECATLSGKNKEHRRTSDIFPHFLAVLADEFLVQYSRPIFEVLTRYPKEEANT